MNEQITHSRGESLYKRRIRDVACMRGTMIDAQAGDACEAAQLRRDGSTYRVGIVQLPAHHVTTHSEVIGGQKIIKE